MVIRKFFLRSPCVEEARWDSFQMRWLVGGYRIVFWITLGMKDALAGGGGWVGGRDSITGVGGSIVVTSVESATERYNQRITEAFVRIAPSFLRISIVAR